MVEKVKIAIHNAMYGALPEREEGQGMTEYALILSGVALLAITAVFNLGPRIAALFNKVTASLS